MDKKTVQFSYKSPYYQIGSISDQTKEIWLVFHGYGQLAEEFLEEFSGLAKADSVFLFPQGLSKFYLKGVGNKIGASWMTAHDRELDITNYLTYIDQLFSLEIQQHLEHTKLNIFGFSQGGHTASRWVNHARIKYEKFVLWGSSLAHEINTEDIHKGFSAGKNILIIGDEDRFISSDQLEKTKRRYSRLGFRI